MVGASSTWVRPWSRRPRAEASAALTTVSAMPAASLAMVLAVAGATSQASNGRPSERCSARQVREVISGFKLAHSSAWRPTKLSAASVQKAVTSAPRRRRALASSGVLMAAMPPQTSRAMRLPARWLESCGTSWSPITAELGGVNGHCSKVMPTALGAGGECWR